MALYKNKKTLLRFYVDDHNLAASWYREQIGKEPVHIDDHKAVFYLEEDSVLVLMKKNIRKSTKKTRKTLNSSPSSRQDFSNGFETIW